MTYPTPPVLPARRPSAKESPLFTEDAHPVRPAVAVVAGILLWLAILVILPTVV